MKSRSSSIQRGDSAEKSPEDGHRKWASALRVVTAVTRLKNLKNVNVSVFCEQERSSVSVE